MVLPPQPVNAKINESTAPNAGFFIAAYSTHTLVRSVNPNRMNDQESPGFLPVVRAWVLLRASAHCCDRRFGVQVDDINPALVLLPNKTFVIAPASPFG